VAVRWHDFPLLCLPAQISRLIRASKTPRPSVLTILPNPSAGFSNRASRR
jgi:hypothetical protein